MFYILVMLGAFFIGLGVFLERQKEEFPEENLFIDEIYRANVRNENIAGDDYINSPIDRGGGLEGSELVEDLEFLERRIETLEDILFSQVLEEEKLKRSKEPEEASKEESKDSLENYRLIKKYEDERKSLYEISKLLKMNKGEVLLLKNLYKNS